MRWGAGEDDLVESDFGDVRERGRKREKPASLSFSLGCWAVSAKLDAVGETVGETTSNLPSKREPVEWRLLFEGSFSSFLRPNTFDKNEGMAWPG